MVALPSLLRPLHRPSPVRAAARAVLPRTSDGAGLRPTRAVARVFLRGAAGLLTLALLLTLLAPGRPAPAPAAVGEVAATTDRLLVQPQPGLEATVLAATLRAAGFDAQPAPGTLQAAVVPVPAAADPSALAQHIATLPGAAHVEADGLVSAARLPDDPLYGTHQARYLEAVRAPDAWERETGSPDVLVAVIDTGIDIVHPDLVRRISVHDGDRLGDGLDDDGNGCPDDVFGCSFVTPETADPSCGSVPPPPHPGAVDDEGHGTFVAGLIAAAGDERGMTGVAWDVRLLPVKVLDCTATGRISDAAAGIRYAVAMGADVINISFGSSQDSRVLRAAIEDALAAGAIVVAAAGNTADAPVHFPARYEGVIAVGGSGWRLPGNAGVDYGLAAPFSPDGAAVDLLAPAVDLLAPLPRRMCEGGDWRCAISDGPYAVASGTSFAAPLVSGAVALLRSQHPDLNATLLRGLLLGGAQPLSDERVPLLDVAGALERPLYGIGAPGTARPPLPGLPVGPR